MKYLLDTDTCIYIINKSPKSVVSKITKMNIGDIGLSSVTWSELVYGAEKSTRREQNLKALELFVSSFEVLPFTQREAELSGAIRASLEKKGKMIGSYDILIAAHALCCDIPLVTNNEREFSRVPNLKIENWTK